MTGDLGEKARAAFLALIMVTSVLMTGVAFSGSAAAESIDTNGEGVAIADSANLNIAGQRIIIQAYANQTLTWDSAVGDLIVIDGFNNVDLSVFNADTNAQIGNAALDVYVGGTSLDSNSGASAQASVSEGTLTIDQIDANNNNPSDGDVITVVLDGSELADGTFTTPSSSSTDTLDITVSGADESDDTVANGVDLSYGSDAPITVNGNDGESSTTEYHSVLSSAVDAIGSADNTVEITGNVSNVDYSGNLDINNDATIDESGVTVTGNGNTVSIDNDDDMLTLNSDNITVQNVTFDVPLDSDAGNSADKVVNINGPDVVVDSNEFNVSAGTGDGNSQSSTNNRNNFFTVQVGADDVEITGNTISDNAVDGFGAMQVVQANGDGLLFDNNIVDAHTGVYLSGGEATVSGNEMTVLDYAVGTSPSGARDPSDSSITGNTIRHVVPSSGDANSGLTASGAAIDISDGDNMVLTNNTIDGQSTEFTYGIWFNSNSATTLANATVNGTTEITNVSDDGIRINNPSGTFKSGVPVMIEITGARIISDVTNGIDIDVGDGSVAPDVSVSDSTIDQAGTGILINDFDNTNRQNVTVNNTEINGSSSAGIDINSGGTAPHTNDLIEVTDSTFTNNAGGINVSEVQTDADAASGAEFNIHFNTFEDNTDAGVFVDDGDFSDTLNLTFNDFENNANNGLEVNAIDADGGADDGVVNANYSWWGSDAGPNSDFGDSVSADPGEATVEPFLLESAVDNYDDSNLGGTNVLRFGHNVEVTNNKGAVSFPTTANRTAGASIEGNTDGVMVYKLVGGAFVDAGDEVPQTMEGHVIDLTGSDRTSVWVTISYSDDVQDGLGGITYEQGQNLVGSPIQGDATAATTLGLGGKAVISPFLSNTDDKFEQTDELSKASARADLDSETVSPFKAYIVEVPDADDDLVDRFRGGNIPGGTDASEVEALLKNE